MKTLGHVSVYSAPDPKIARLAELAYNLWWSWNPDAQALYEDIDPELWKQVNHNPVKFLRLVSQGRLDAAASDPSYLARYEAVMRAFDAYMNPEPGSTWYARHYPDQGEPHDRLLLRRVRPAREPAHLLRRPGHPGRRSLQDRQRPGPAVRRRRLPLSAGLLPAAHRRRRPPAGDLREARLRRGACAAGARTPRASR